MTNNGAVRPPGPFQPGCKLLADQLEGKGAGEGRDVLAQMAPQRWMAPLTPIRSG